MRTGSFALVVFFGLPINHIYCPRRMAEVLFFVCKGTKNNLFRVTKTQQI